jgi:AbrB family looped-hinge helix DNA binding protein
VSNRGAFPMALGPLLEWYLTWYAASMRTTIDGGGRVVVPKPMREALGLHAGSEVEVVLRDGRVEIEPASAPMRLVERGGVTVAESDVQLPALTTEQVREVLDRVRR